jgi:pimeloyl-ACP methyl ester carboxylesterase
MVKRTRNPWETTSKSELVSIGTHKLFLSTSGPARTPGTPVVIFFTGGGVPVAAHVRLQAMISDFARVYFYDRSGYDRSESSPIPHPTAADAAAELRALLRAVKVDPPYVLVAHSYGALVAREFLDLHSSSRASVVGMVLAESATELMYEVFPTLSDADYNTVTAGIDFVELTHLREESKLSDEQWKAVVSAIARTEQGSKTEDTRGSGRSLAAKNQFQNQALDQWPLSVVRCNFPNDWRVMYEAGLKMGNGSKEQQAEARKFVETWELFDDDLRACQLRLSGRSRYRQFTDCGHDVPVRRPEYISEEIKWVLEQLESDRIVSSVDSNRADRKSRRHMPDPEKLRTWVDRSGSFKVAAQFIKHDNGKIHLHKHTGVRIAVPTFRLCVEDLEYVEKATGVLLTDKRMVASRASPSSSHLDVEA